MASGTIRRTRADRVTGLIRTPGKWEQAWNRLRHRDVAVRVAIGVLSTLVTAAVIRAWDPPSGIAGHASLAIDSRAGLPAGTSYRWFPSPPPAADPDTEIRAQQITQEQTDADAELADSFLRYRDLRGWPEKLRRFLGAWLIVVGGFSGIAAYLFLRHRRILVSIQRLTTLLVLYWVTLAVALWLAQEVPYAEICPLLIFTQILAVAYSQEFAVLFGGVAALTFLLATGQDVGSGILLGTAVIVSVLQLQSLRGRAKLIYVGFWTAAAAMVIRFVLALANEVPLDATLAAEIGRIALAVVATGFLVTGLLPFVERFFGVLTDMSLLELTDLSHPLLRELARRAPSTYNHSINVGAIAEAAADAIGARGLLVRVGAYFHDIGKMINPQYFIENQAGNPNRHETLEPTMSSMVIISHVKDGADLARRYHLPEPIIDFIEQHHGTTLVEYFYGRAREKSEGRPEGSAVDAEIFRYPGPPPQTKEAAVLMLADAVESAVRSLKDPAPSRIEAVVREIAERKLDEGQFDFSNLTLRELRAIEDAMIKTLTAMYHGRIKYPERTERSERATDRKTEEPREGAKPEEPPAAKSSEAEAAARPTQTQGEAPGTSAPSSGGTTSEPAKPDSPPQGSS
ncbi:HD family phosphohydrolase [Thermopirellula anaerolimosa]